MPIVDDPKTAVLMLRISTKLKAACEKIAGRSGLTTSEWCRAVLARAAHEGAFAPRKPKGGKDGRKRKN